MVAAMVVTMVANCVLVVGHESMDYFSHCFHPNLSHHHLLLMAFQLSTLTKSSPMPSHSAHSDWL